MILSLFRALLWLMAVVAVIQIGWDEPLSYRFKTAAQIAALERAAAPPPPRRVWTPRPTRLNQPAKSVK